MIINLNQQNGIALPSLLLSDMQAPLYHTVYKLRHPLAIYNVSYSTVLDHFGKTISTLFQAINERTFLIISKENGDRSTIETLLSNERDLLYSLMEYLEDCDNILACFFSSEYRDHIGKIVNYLKHNQGRLRSIAFFDDEVLLPGYYVMGPDEESTLGAVELIHAGGNTAFSFARDLHYSFLNFYAISQHMSDALRGILGYKGIIASVDNPQHPDDRAIKIASDIASLPLVFYPDEANKPVPTITKSHDHVANIILTYPNDEVIVETVQKGMYVVADQMGEGATWSFRFPYIHKKN